jgi:hypothetical protein
MTEDRTGHDAGERSAEGDYGYDLAHDAHDALPEPDDEAERYSAPLAAVAPDEGGDYGYDLAHDMRPE